MVQGWPGRPAAASARTARSRSGSSLMTCAVPRPVNISPASASICSATPGRLVSPWVRVASAWLAWGQLQQGREVGEQAHALGGAPEGEPGQATAQHDPAHLDQRLPAAFPDPVEARRHVEAVIIKRQRGQVSDPHPPGCAPARSRSALRRHPAQTPWPPARRRGSLLWNLPQHPAVSQTLTSSTGNHDRDGHPQPSRQLPDGERRGTLRFPPPRADRHARARGVRAWTDHGGGG